ncbi:hypothetical protein FI667_g6977, partial [Globisporangium splendens]
MFVFAGAHEGDDASPLALRSVTTKDALPFEELFVVAGVIHATRQLTCLSARILEVGEGAVQFAHDVRGCFPTLVRRNPMAFAADSDDESGDDDADEEERKGKEAHEKKRQLANESQRQQQHMQDAGKYMDRTRIKLVTSLEEVFHAFEIEDRAKVHAALHRQCSDCQWLCIDLPAQQQASVPTSPGLIIHDCGVLFTHDSGEFSAKGRHFLQIPLPRTPNGYFAVEDPETEVFQDATVLSFGAKREATSHGGGKTPDEMVQNIRMRHASGTFCTLVVPETTWEQVATKHNAVLPQARELHGDLRLRRIMGPAVNAGVELVLEKQ